jgi:rhodanese-related sulfurtransferase
MKTAKHFLDEAHAVVPKVSTEEAIKKHGTSAIFVDVRDSADIAKSGTIEGAIRAQRGFIEFLADESTPFHNAALKKDAEIYLICGAGGQAALTGKTLKDMGFKNVFNIGGFNDWKKAGGPVED